MNIYVPVWFQIKSNSNLTNGAWHFFTLLNCLQSMTQRVRDIVKGGESSSQFQWFTKPKIEPKLSIFLVLILGLLLQRYSTNTKRYPPKKFLETQTFVLPAKIIVL